MDNNAIDSHEDASIDPHPSWSDLLGTWRLCRKRICQRRKCCCGETSACLKTNLPLLPESVQLWFVTLMQCKSAGLSFEEMMKQLDGTWQEEGYIAWRKAIGQPVTAPDA